METTRVEIQVSYLTLDRCICTWLIKKSDFFVGRRWLQPGKTNVKKYCILRMCLGPMNCRISCLVLTCDWWQNYFFILKPQLFFISFQCFISCGHIVRHHDAELPKLVKAREWGRGSKHFCRQAQMLAVVTLMARFMGTPWGPSGSCRHEVGPI